MVPALELIHPQVALGPCAPLGAQSLQLSTRTATANRLGMLPVPDMCAQFENARSGLKDTRETAYCYLEVKLRSMFLPSVFAGSGVSATPQRLWPAVHGPHDCARRGQGHLSTPRRTVGELEENV